MGRFGTINDSLWDTATTGEGIACSSCTLNNAFGKTTAEMKQIARYTALGWDFESVCTIDEDENYPRLRRSGTSGDSVVDVIVSDDDPTGIKITWSEAENDI